MIQQPKSNIVEKNFIKDDNGNVINVNEENYRLYMILRNKHKEYKSMVPKIKKIEDDINIIKNSLQDLYSIIEKCLKMEE